MEALYRKRRQYVINVLLLILLMKLKKQILWVLGPFIGQLLFVLTCWLAMNWVYITILLHSLDNP